MPLRPLSLSDIYDAAFRIIRFNPRATVGAAVLVAAVSMLLPLVVTSVLTATSNLAFDADQGDSMGSADLAALIGSFGSLGVGLVLNAIGTLLVGGLITHVVMAAAIGRKLTLGQAWAATHGSRWRLIGLTLLIGVAATVLVAAYTAAWIPLVLLTDRVAVLVIWGVLTVPLAFAALVWLWVRFAYLAVPALMLERLGVLGAPRRAFRLSKRQFWRTFGIYLLTVVVAGVAAQVLTTPISLVLGLVLAGLGPEYVALTLVLTQAVSAVITAAFVTPFTGAVTSLQYLDQRMRKEAYDVELMQQAGITAS